MHNNQYSRDSFHGNPAPTTLPLAAKHVSGEKAAKRKTATQKPVDGHKRKCVNKNKRRLKSDKQASHSIGKTQE